MRTLLLLGLGLACACGSSGAAQTPAGTSLMHPGPGAEAAELTDAGLPGEMEDEGGAEPPEADPYEATVDDLLKTFGVPGQPSPRSALGLRLGLAEGGPEKPWLLAIVNDGDSPVRIVADPRLLRLSVEVPGKKRETKCQLPGSLFPSKPDRRLLVTLAPGEGVAHAFDPRLYCFDSGRQKQLVPGALITPHYGWPEPTEVQRRRGKRSDAHQKSPPYVAELAPEEGADPRTQQGNSDGLKELTGNTFALRSTYAEWVSKARQHTAEHPDAPLTIRMVQGSDAQAERSATVQLSVTNASKAPIKLYFRRELLSFEVMGPDGISTCDPQPDARSPDPQSYSTLKPGAHLTVTSRLVELCPSGTFARPGLYLVHARYDAKESGDAFGIDAYTGTVASPQPVAVRVRQGELPFLRKLQMRRILVPDAEPEPAASAQ